MGFRAMHSRFRALLPDRLPIHPALRQACGGPLVAIAISVLAAARLHAQVVAPPVVEYDGRASGPSATFDVSNRGLRPVAVVLEAHAFWVDTLGEVHYAPFDTSRVKLELSTMSLRLPPRSTYAVQYDAHAAKLPAWFVITATFAGPPTPGLNIRLQLPHVVYLDQSQPLEARDVAITAFQYDARAKLARFRIVNRGDRLGRCTRGHVEGGRRSQPIPDFPLFPRFTRWVTVPWPSPAPPDQLELSCGDFTVRAAHATPVPRDGPRSLAGE